MYRREERERISSLCWKSPSPTILKALLLDFSANSEKSKVTSSNSDPFNVAYILFLPWSLRELCPQMFWNFTVMSSSVALFSSIVLGPEQALSISELITCSSIKCPWVISRMIFYLPFSLFSLEMPECSSWSTRTGLPIFLSFLFSFPSLTFTL